MDKWRCYKNRIQNAYVRYFGYLLDLSKGFIFNLSFMLGMFIYLFFIISSAINIPGITIFTLGGFIVIVVLILYVDTIKHVLKNAPPRTKTHTAFVLSVYPVRLFSKRLYRYNYVNLILSWLSHWMENWNFAGLLGAVQVRQQLCILYFNVRGRGFPSTP